MPRMKRKERKKKKEEITVCHQFGKEENSYTKLGEKTCSITTKEYNVR